MCPLAGTSASYVTTSNTLRLHNPSWANTLNWRPSQWTWQQTDGEGGREGRAWMSREWEIWSRIKDLRRNDKRDSKQPEEETQHRKCQVEKRRIPSALKQQVAHIHTSPSIHYQSYFSKHTLPKLPSRSASFSLNGRHHG